MLKLNINVNFDDCGCFTTYEDITGFTVNSGQDGKFILEGDPLPSNKDFHLSDGTFVNAIYLKDYDDKTTVFETSDIPNVIPSALVKPIYKDNIKIAKESIPSDGKIYIGRYFIMSNVHYQNDTSRFTLSEPIVYYDENDGYFYLLENGDITILKTVKELVSKVDTKTTQGLVYTNVVLFSICHLKKCYQNMLQDQFDKLLGYDTNTNLQKCLTGNCLDSAEDIQLKNNIELLHNAITVINYLLDCGKYEDAMRLLNLLGRCGGICFKYNKNSKNGCGC